MTEDLNTLICLFHHQQYAQVALEEILAAGIPEANVTLIGAPGSNIQSSQSSLSELNVPQKDLQHLLDGVRSGGAVLSVSAISSDADKVEAIFSKHRAGKIDEAEVADDQSAQAIPFAASTAVPAVSAKTPVAVMPAAPVVEDVDDYPEPVALAGNAASAETDELVVIERDLLLVPDPAHSTDTVDAFEVVPVITETVIPLQTTEDQQPVSRIGSHDENGKPDLDPREMGFDPRMQPVVFSPQVH